MKNSEWRQLYEELAEMYFRATGELVHAPVVKDTGKALRNVIVAPAILKKLYVDDGMRIVDMAEILQCSKATVSNLLKRAGIQARSPAECPRSELQKEQAKKNLKSRTGRHWVTKRRMAAGYEFGGYERISNKGYILVYAPEHPRANKAHEVPKHTLVMERHLGRYLADDEVVHHINRDRADNRIENLKVMKIEEHKKLHADEMRKETKHG